ncbi:hypothetical protein HQ545_01595 [Candidatus Woesearchaeota archaeon]|nr:hypothetical protein [Candidatus Woesearchaeota archaeon]
MSRESHMEQVERWANFVKNNPNKWRKDHTGFINALFDKHYKFVERLAKIPGGKEKLIKAYNIKNKKGYSWLE